MKVIDRIRKPSTGAIIGSVSFSYIALLLLLPITALSVEALKGGVGELWKQITQPQALYAIKLTFTMALMMTAINIVTGTATAWVLVRYRFPLKSIIDAMVDIPFAIPTVVTGMMLVLLYGPHSFIGIFFEKHGLPVIYNKPGILLALLFVTFPFSVRSVQPVLKEMEKDMEEAARTLGATQIQTFVRIVLPTLAPSILTGAALSFSRALGEFGSIVMVAGNIPFKTQVSAVYIYGEVESANLPGALGVSFLLLLSSLLIMLLLNRLQKWNRKYES